MGGMTTFAETESAVAALGKHIDFYFITSRVSKMALLCVSLLKDFMQHTELHFLTLSHIVNHEDSLRISPQAFKSHEQ